MVVCYRLVVLQSSQTIIGVNWDFLSCSDRPRQGGGRAGAKIGSHLILCRNWDPVTLTSAGTKMVKNHCAHWLARLEPMFWVLETLLIRLVWLLETTHLCVASISWFHPLIRQTCTNSLTSFEFTIARPVCVFSLPIFPDWWPVGWLTIQSSYSPYSPYCRCWQFRPYVDYFCHSIENCFSLSA